MSKTRGRKSRITSIRLPYPLDEALQDEAKRQGLPWQTLAKQLLAEALGIGLETLGSETEVVRRSSKGLRVAVKRLSKN